MEKKTPISVWIGYVTSGVVVAMMTMSATMKFIGPEFVTKDWEGKFGYPLAALVPIGAVELACVLLYLIPRTSVLGAILLTGYLGGAIATHARINDNFAGGVVAGVLVWLGLFLRDARIRDLIPFRSPPSGT